MRQEHRFVADLYRYLAPFIDPDKPIYLSLDGEAAKKGVREKVFDDGDVPDLWFTLVGNPTETLLEAKTLSETNRITLGGRQLAAWRSSGEGKHRPWAWVAASIDLRQLYFWEHEAFLESLDDCRSNAANCEFRLPETHVAFRDIRALALHILRNAGR
jgi:hypothetical protein